MSLDQGEENERFSKLLKGDEMASGAMEAEAMSSDQMEKNEWSSKSLEGNHFPSVTMECNECDVCKDNVDDQTTWLPPASKRCTECQQNLCSQCVVEHRRQKCLKNHQIVEILCQVEKNAVACSQSNAEATVEQNLCDDSVNVSSGRLSTKHAQHRTSGTDVMAQITTEKYRLKKYEAEMTTHVDQLLKGQEGINAEAENITSMILKKYSECLARLESDKKHLVEQLDSGKKKQLSENEIKLQEAINYLKKITDRRKNLEEILRKGSVEENDKSTKSILLHIHFPLPIASMANVSFQESSTWNGTDTNILGRLEGPLNIPKTQTEPTLTGYMNFLKDAHSRATEAKEIQWRMTILNEVDIISLYDLDTLKRVQIDLNLSINDKKRDELLEKHVKMASYLHEVTSNNMDNYIKEFQHITERLWNTIQFHICYKNSETGLIPQGFPNFGNTCYFNAVLQSLLQTVLLPFELTMNLYSLENVFDVEKEMQCLSKAFMELSSRYKDCESRKGSLKALFCKFKEAVGLQRFNDQGQHDSHDLLIHFLDKLRMEERDAWGIGLPSAGPETQKMLTAVDRIFGGQFITVYTCHSCKEPYVIREPFLDISIPLCMLTPDEQKAEENKSKSAITSEFEFLPESVSIAVRYDTSDKELALGSSDAKVEQRSLADVGNYVETHFSSETILSSSSATDDSSRKDLYTKEAIKNMLQPIAVEASGEHEVKSSFFDMFSTSKPSVSHCLKYFTRAEVIKDEYLCRNCQKPESDELVMTSATKRTLISSPPAVLVLHLKRFEQTPIGFVKRDGMILYNELLDLGPFCSSSALRIDPEEENAWYSLYAVVVHSGFLLSHGHYVAYVKQRDASGQINDQLREKFLQKNFGERDKVPNDDDLEALEKRKKIQKRGKANRPQPIPGQWFCISDDSVRPCDAKKALDQKAFLLFYERIPGTGQQCTAI